MKLLNSLILFLGTTTVLAGWDPESLKVIESWQKKPVPFHDPFTATTQGFAKTYFCLSYRPPVATQLPSTHFETQGLRVFLGIQKKSGKIVKAPFVAVATGIFTELNGWSASVFFGILKKHGYHVLVLTNPWSRSYIQHKPLAPTGDILGEAEVFVDMLREAQRKIGLENISSIEFLGESYGSYIVSIATYLLHQRDLPGPKQITFLSPPINLKTAGNVLDRLMQQSERLSSCGNLWNRLSLGLKLVTHSNDKNFTKNDLACGEWWLSEVGFRDRLKQSFGEARENLFFSSFDKKFSASPSLAEWFHRIKNIPTLNSFRIFAAQDDFLNQGESWMILAKNVFNPSEIQFIPWGGHAGYRSQPEFQRLLRTAFPEIRLERKER